MARKFTWTEGEGEAAEMLQCDRACYGAEILLEVEGEPGFVRFNVTAPVMARKSHLVRVVASTLDMLQCDRACYGAEMQWLCEHSEFASIASM